MSLGKRARNAPEDSTGVVVAARVATIDDATREVRASAWKATQQRRPRERWNRPVRMADGGVVAWKPGNAGGAKAPCFRANAGKRQEPED